MVGGGANLAGGPRALEAFRAILTAHNVNEVFPKDTADADKMAKELLRVG